MEKLKRRSRGRLNFVWNAGGKKGRHRINCRLQVQVPGLTLGVACLGA